jgi:hypothetical protein
MTTTIQPTYEVVRLGKVIFRSNQKNLAVDITNKYRYIDGIIYPKERSDCRTHCRRITENVAMSDIQYEVVRFGEIIYTGSFSEASIIVDKYRSIDRIIIAQEQENSESYTPDCYDYNRTFFRPIK